MARDGVAGRFTNRVRDWFRARRAAPRGDLSACLRVSLYRGVPEDRRDASALDVGSFLRQFLDAPRDLAAAGTPGVVRLSAEWRHPWELAVVADVAGTNAFLAGLPDVLGRRIADWLV